MKSKYITINSSDIYKDSYGNEYPDIFTFPINEFKVRKSKQEYILTSTDIQRFDILISKYYGNANYDDIILWYNNIEFISDVEPGTKIELLDKEDIDTFYREFIK